MNQSDSEVMSGLLSEAGYILTDNETLADIVIINSCTVKNPTQTKFLKLLDQFKKNKTKVIVAGCIPQAEQSYVNTKFKELSIVGVFDIHRIADAVKETLSGKRVVFMSGSAEDKKNLN